MSHQQNQANNMDGNGNIQLHLNANISRMAYATIASSSPVRTQSPAEMPRILQQQPKPQLQIGDIYEFHSSPEEDNFSAAPGSGFLPFANPTAICSQQKSSSASSIPNILATASTSCPPPKRIKTAVLAKKLLAAAAVIDPTKLPKSEERKNVPTETMDGEKELNKTEGESAMENLIEENEKDGGDMMMEEMEGTTIEEDLQQKQRANSISSTASQEQKKVPPLRISLLKTPSEENGELPKQSSTASSSSPCGVATNVSRKTRGGAIRIGSGGGLRKVGGGHGHHHESKKDNLQRVTRSKVKQINSSNETGDIQHGHHGRKRRNRGIGAERGGGNIIEMEEEMANNSSSTLSMRTFAPFEEEEDNNSATMMNNAQMDEEGIIAAENGTIIRRNNSILGEEQHRNGNEELQQQNSEMGNSGTVEIEKAPAKPSAASIMLNKNSLEQSFGFESMMREKWTKQYKTHLAHVIDRVNMATKLDDEHQPPNNGACQFSSSKSEPPKLINNEWPEPLKKLYTEQEKRRQELAEEHRLDRERIQSMVQREIVRFEETNSQQNGGGLFSIVSYLRDIECYDPTLLAESLNKLSPIHQPTNRFQNQTLQQIQQRFAYLANTTKNRHTLEAQSLAGNQKAEWQRIARRIQRENEQQQLMLKGPIGSGAVGKQQKSTISFPADFWAESAVNQISIPEIQFPTQFQNVHPKLF